MTVTNMQEAKTHLSRLVEDAVRGKEIVIGKAGRPMVRLVPFVKQKTARRPGRLKGKIRMSKDFDDSLPSEILASFLGNDSKES